MGSKNLRLAELATNVDASGAYTQVQGVTTYANTAAFPVSGNAAGDLAFDDSDNGLYIYTGEGWYNIGLVNQTPTITSGGAGSYLLATDGTPTVITLIGSDPDGFPVTWSYSTSGLDSEATIVQGTGDSSNIFTITPNTNEAKAGTFTITFSLTDGLNIATDVNSFTLVFGDGNIDKVVSLLQTERSTWIADAGSSKLDLNVRNNTYPTSFSPYRGSYYSVEFDGTGDYISTTSYTGVQFTGDFTVECWIYCPSFSSIQIIMDARGNNIASTPWQLYTNTSGQAVFNYGSNLIGSTTISTNTWTHIAVTRSGTSLKLFVNGTQDAAATTSASLSGVGGPFYIGRTWDTSGTLYFTGYISNARIVKGTALYTGEFTPATSAFTNDANTLLLLHMDGSDGSTTFEDDNGNNDRTQVSVTGYNQAQIDTAKSKFGGSSLLLDGLDDKLTATIPAIGTGEFTWECWLNFTDTNGGGIIVVGGVIFYLRSDNRLGFYYSGSDIVPYGATTLSTNTWYHVAATRSSSDNKIRLYVNGVLDAISPSAFTTSIGTDLVIGEANSTVDLLAHIDEVRISNTDRYLGGFTPATSPLTTTSQGATASEVSLLACQSNRFIDNSTNGHTITVTGDAAISGRTPFATPTAMESYGSGYFSGSDDRIDTSGISPDALSVGTSDYCFEMWIYVEQIIGTWIPVYIGGIGRLSFLITDSGTNFQVANYGYSGVVNKTGSLVFNAWNHVAFTRDNGTSRIYHNGSQLGTDATESNNWSSSGFVIGADHLGTGNELQGYIADARIVVGSPVYTSSFSVPTAPLSAITNTKLLILQNSYPHNNKSITERSGANTSLENYGEVNTSSFSPYSPFGYSNYFDGTGDYLVVPANNDFLFDAGDFTIEAWIHPNVTGTQIGIVNNWQIGGAFQFYILNTNKLYFMFTHVSSGASSVNWTSTDSISPDVWTHVALVRSGSNLYFYINGTLDSGGAQSITQTMYYYNGAAKDLKIGTAGDTGSLWNGYISNLRIIKGVGLYTTNFTPSTSALTPTDETVLLTCQSPSFIDNGPKKHSLTRYGDARVTPYSPLKGHTVTPDTHGVYFKGDGGDYLKLNTVTALGTDDFTIELWIYFNEQRSNACIMDQNSGVMIRQYNANILFYDRTNNQTFESTSGPFSVGQWHHVAVVRQYNVKTEMFVDGVSVATSTTVGDATNFTGTDMWIGGFKDSQTNTTTINGSMSNFRIIKGTALYTSAFTPSTSPLTTTSQGATSSEVELLICQDSTLVDNSSNAYTITSNGSAQPTEFNPFGYTTTTNQQYSPTTHGGSMYGDGTTDYVDVPANAWNSLGTGDFCIQFWTYSKEVDANKGQIAIGGNKISIRFDSSNRMTFWVAGNGGATSTPNNTVYPFNWYHVCLERSGSTNTLYINGVAQATNTTTPSNDATPIIRIGGQYADNTGYTFTGWISDLSIRSKAVYKGNFVPPKQVVYGDQTKLQVPFDAAVYDSKGQLTYEINSLRVSNKAGKFNNQALKFAGVNDYVYTEERHGTAKVYGEQLMLGTGDYTIEFWWNFAATANRQDLLWIGSASTRLGILWNLNAGQLTYYPATDAISATVSFSADTWYHIAVARSSGYTKMFVDGTQVGSTYTDSKDFNGTILYLGKDSGANSSYSNGYMDGLRITRGVARYTSNFTAPTDVFSKR